MPMKRIDGLKWNEVDLDTMTKAQRHLLLQWREARLAAYNSPEAVAARAAEAAFKEEMQSYAPRGKQILITDRFQKLKVAVADVSARQPKEGKIDLSKL